MFLAIQCNALIVELMLAWEHVLQFLSNLIFQYLKTRCYKYYTTYIANHYLQFKGLSIIFSIFTRVQKALFLLIPPPTLKCTIKMLMPCILYVYQITLFITHLIAIKYMHYSCCILYSVGKYRDWSWKDYKIMCTCAFV